MRILIISLLIICIVKPHLKANEIIPIAPDFTYRHLDNEVFYIVDKERTLSFEDITKEHSRFDFVKHDEQIPYLQFLTGNIWIKVIIENQTFSMNDLIFHFDFPLNDTVIFFHKLEGRYLSDTLGYAIPFNERQIKNKDPLFKLRLYPHIKHILYFKIINTGIECPLPIGLYSEDSFYEQNDSNNFFYGIYYGILILIIIINIFFYINLKDTTYLYYILYVISLTLFILVRDGYAFKYLWPNCLWCAKQSAFQFAPLSIIFMLLFTQSAIKSSFYFPRINKILLIVLLFNILFSLTNLFLPTPMHALNNVFTLLSSIPILIVSISVIKIKQLVLGKYYFVSVVFLIAGVSIFISKNLGLTSFFIGELSLKLAFITQLLILSYGLIAMYQSTLKDTNQSVVDNLKQLNQVKDQLNERLENEVKVRTIELDKKNEELIAVNKQIGAERDIFEMQRNLITIQKKQTTDSILYAKRIQSTLMQPNAVVKQIFPDSIILDFPKDIVSGDFYWVHDLGSWKLAAVADCTGHGVPGAFMSIIGFTYLNEIVRNSPNLKPNEILFQLREQLINSLNKESNTEIKDGMDISLVSINNEKTKLYYAGAYNSAYIVRGNELYTLRADRMPISSHDRQTEPFTLIEFNIQKDDMVYLFSDGYVDQFGWRTGKKFKHKQFKELLLDINEMPTEVKQVVIRNSLKNWKGDLEQVDDIMILGFKI